MSNLGDFETLVSTCKRDLISYMDMGKDIPKKKKESITNKMKQNIVDLCQFIGMPSSVKVSISKEKKRCSVLLICDEFSMRDQFNAMVVSEMFGIGTEYLVNTKHEFERISRELCLSDEFLLEIVPKYELNDDRRELLYHDLSDAETGAPKTMREFTKEELLSEMFGAQTQLVLGTFTEQEFVSVKSTILDVLNNLIGEFSDITKLLKNFNKLIILYDLVHTKENGDMALLLSLYLFKLISTPVHKDSGEHVYLFPKIGDIIPKSLFYTRAGYESNRNTTPRCLPFMQRLFGKFYVHPEDTMDNLPKRMKTTIINMLDSVIIGKFRIQESIFPFLDEKGFFGEVYDDYRLWMGQMWRLEFFSKSDVNESNMSKTKKCLITLMFFPVFVNYSQKIMKGIEGIGKLEEYNDLKSNISTFLEAFMNKSIKPGGNSPLSDTFDDKGNPNLFNNFFTSFDATESNETKKACNAIKLVLDNYSGISERVVKAYESLSKLKLSERDEKAAPYGIFKKVILDPRNSKNIEAKEDQINSERQIPYSIYGINDHTSAPPLSQLYFTMIGYLARTNIIGKIKKQI